MYFKIESSVFCKLMIFICLLLSVLTLGESVSNSNLENSNNRKVSFGLVGGKYVDIKHAKYVGSLLSSGSLVGTITILNKRWVLTSARNFYAYGPADSLQVRVGSNYHDTEGALYQVTRAVVHPSFNRAKGKVDYNLALLKLDKPIEFSSVAGKIKISPYKIRDNHSHAKVYGFGWNAQRILIGKLQEITIPIIHYKTCQKHYHERKHISSINFCSAKKEVQPSYLEEGSPVVQNKKLIGLFTDSLKSSKGKSVSVYTDVTRFKKWIHDTIKDG